MDGMSRLVVPDPEIETTYPDFTFVPSTSSTCDFPASSFLDVMLNLIRNPNLTSSHLFRADILYDSENDSTFDTSAATDADICSLSRHMQAQLRPRLFIINDYMVQRTIVRRLVPRNPQLDDPLVQTCHIYKQSIPLKNVPASCEGDIHEAEAFEDTAPERMARTLVVYLPHTTVTNMPYYHPKVNALAFLHTQTEGPPELQFPNTRSKDKENEKPINGEKSWSAKVSLHASKYPLSQPEEDVTTTASQIKHSNRLERMLLKLLQTIIRHGHGLHHGYVKRVHHDIVIPQAQFQDTYTRLKLKYGNEAVHNWKEKTDPTKHVFEDLGIAAFLIELWRTMYSSTKGDISRDSPIADSFASLPAPELMPALPSFPGFVDIGCGNGFLVHVLLSEGYPGSGFDVHARKSWASYPPSTQCQLSEQILVPALLRKELPQRCSHQVCESNYYQAPPTKSQGSFKRKSSDTLTNDVVNMLNSDSANIIDGRFPANTFIISNHADELTLWTPLLARLSGGSPFLAIPCCSHDLSGARTRFSARAAAGPSSKAQPSEAQLTHQSTSTTGSEPAFPQCYQELGKEKSRQNSRLADPSEARVGAAPPKAVKLPSRPPSAFSTLCDYVERLSRDVGYVTKREMLRIPSTRNVGIVGTPSHGDVFWSSLTTAKDGESSISMIKDEAAAVQESLAHVVVSEMSGHSIEELSQSWWARMEKIKSTKNSGH